MYVHGACHACHACHARHATGTAEYEAQRRLGRQGLLVQGAPAFVKSVVICFLTDGEDGALRSARGNEARLAAVREELVGSLRTILGKWEKKVRLNHRT